MNDDLEKLLNAPPDDFERALFLVERELDLLGEHIAHTGRVTHALDRAFDNLLECVAADTDDPPELDSTRTLVRKFRGFRLVDADEQLARIFSVLHKMHEIHKGQSR